jgi:hypothetical protein
MVLKEIRGTQRKPKTENNKQVKRERETFRRAWCRGQREDNSCISECCRREPVAVGNWQRNIDGSSRLVPAHRNVRSNTDHETAGGGGEGEGGEGKIEEEEGGRG